jgi:hypothetical protein
MPGWGKKELKLYEHLVRGQNDLQDQNEITESSIHLTLLSRQGAE